ncbi:MAG: hypothetical protein AAF993_10750 [Pseudomonadota bacterium]
MNPRKTLTGTLTATLTAPLTAIGAALLLSSTIAVADANSAQSDAVQVPSLKVKERLQSIEQINVTSEKTVQDIQVESQAVANLLEEADQLDQLDTAATDRPDK